ncbi:Uncharacterised protein [Vibrio cholerae]|nr:Uncharacterised protein [Vibrio cholerae]CSH97534.1 Uncharacterised protein [Vibrio cholerae]
MFSQPAKTPITLSGRPSLAIAFMVPNTDAAPHMSYFISSIPSPGLSEIPPESKVRPLPTNTMGLASGSGLPLYSMTDIMDSLREPRPTAR